MNSDQTRNLAFHCNIYDFERKIHQIMAMNDVRFDFVEYLLEFDTRNYVSIEKEESSNNISQSVIHVVNFVYVVCDTAPTYSEIDLMPICH